MAPTKRKKEIETPSARPDKKRKPSSTTKLSGLREEEPAFPRGGASVLTPLEHKQIQIQAKQDVLFEQRTGKKVSKNGYDDEENDENMPEEANTPPTKAKRKSKSKENRKITGETIEEPGVRIEGLSYRVCQLIVRYWNRLTVDTAACTRLFGPWAGPPDQSK